MGALTEGKSTIGKPVIGKVLKAPIFLIAVPIRDKQEKVIGALSGITNLGNPSFLDKITESHYGKTGGYLIVAPEYRLIVTATDNSRVMQALPDTGIDPKLDRFLQGYEGPLVHTNQRGVEEMASAKGVPVARWYLAGFLPTDEAFAPILRMQQRMLLATFFPDTASRRLDLVVIAASALATVADVKSAGRSR